MKNLLWIMLGGAIGTACRYMTGLLMTRVWPGFPVGTLTVNLLGCLLIGILAGISSRMMQSWHLILTVGFCGGFTTYSSFVLDGYVLQKESWMSVLLYTGISLVGGFMCCVLGLWLGHKYVQG